MGSLTRASSKAGFDWVNPEREAGLLVEALGGFVERRHSVVNEERRCGEFKKMPDPILRKNPTTF